MNATESALRERIRALTDDSDRRISLARLVDRWAEAAAYNSFTTAHLLSENSQALAAQLFAGQVPGISFWGAYPEAERKLACFLPDYLDESMLPDLCSDTLGAVRCHYPKGSELSHRDFLGSLMGLGIKRDSVGDILIDNDEGTTDIVLMQTILPLILLEYNQASRYSLEVERININDLSIPAVEAVLVSGSVASLRLDALLSLAFRVSRSTAAEIILGGRVFVNGRLMLKTDYLLDAGSKISCQGRGRFELLRVKGLSRKGRTIVELNVSS